MDYIFIFKFGVVFSRKKSGLRFVGLALAIRNWIIKGGDKFYLAEKFLILLMIMRLTPVLVAILILLECGEGLIVPAPTQ